MKKIVLTGGPCGGKTTALRRVREVLEACGVVVHTVPESATLLFEGGVSGARGTYEVQRAIVDLILALETAFARQGQGVLLCDRGVMDTRAYCPPEIWGKILQDLGTDEAEILRSYDHVLHLTTAADGAEEHYSNLSNTTRVETVEEARRVDMAIQSVWAGHPSHIIIPNGMPFDAKMAQVIEHVAGALGFIEREHRFLVGIDTIPVPVERARITQTYLEDGGRLRIREVGERVTYTTTHKRRTSKGSAVEVEVEVSPETAASLVPDPNRAVIRKWRISFEWKGKTFELDVFDDFPFKILEVEVADLDAPLEMPPFVRVFKNITGDDYYSNAELARRFHG